MRNVNIGQPFGGLFGGSRGPAFTEADIFNQIKDTLFPEIDEAAAMEEGQKNTDALIEAHRIMSEGQHQIFIQAMGMLQDAQKESLADYEKLRTGSPSQEELAGLQTQILQKVFDQSIAASRALSKSSRELEEKAQDVLNARFREMIG